jgi:hypothetical protein
MDSSVTPKELRPQEKMRIKVRCRRSRLSKGFPNSRDTQIPRVRKVGPAIHRPILHHKKDWRCGIQDKVAEAIVGREQRLSRVSTTKMPQSARRASGTRHLGPTR